MVSINSFFIISTLIRFISNLQFVFFVGYDSFPGYVAGIFKALPREQNMEKMRLNKDKKKKKEKGEKKTTKKKIKSQKKKKK